MLFNSFEFITLFLPIVLVLFYLSRVYFGFRVSVFVLVVSSFFFYAYWNPPYLILLIVSILVNFSLGTAISNRECSDKAKRLLVTAGIVFNLLLLGYFKYTNFFLDQLELVVDSTFHLDVLLPIGISFYTFQQIAYIMDSYKEKTSYSFLDYCLFVSFFPQLIAGPIVHHAEMMPQFKQNKAREQLINSLSIGVFIFVCGLFKKVVIADNLSLYASPIFNAADEGMQITMIEAWLGTLAYSFQLYFDFSGYSDMAIGLAKMFGINLPLNFNSPYKSTSIIDFWRRWHITLSRFLRDYLYISLGGNRRGGIIRYRNLFLTMLMGGIWHGAGWGFVIWGCLHGLFLVINNIYHQFSLVKGLFKIFDKKLFAWMITFFVVVLAWVPFRATTFEGVVGIWSSMFALNDIGLPVILVNMLGVQNLESTYLSTLVGGDYVLEIQDWAFSGIPLIFASFVIALFLPNSQQLSAYLQDVKSIFRIQRNALSRISAVTTALLFVVVLSMLNGATEFMYFQF